MPLLDLALLVGFLFSVGIYLILERHLLSVFFGIAILSNAANVFVLAMSGPPEGLGSPIVGTEAAKEVGRVMAVDPLPQALILTAIVIGSGILMYLVFLIHRLYVDHGTTDLSVIEKDDTGGVI